MALVSDNFTRANETPLASPWVHTSGSINLSSNKAVYGGSGFAFARYNTALDSNAHYCEMVMPLGNSNLNYGGPMVRVSASGADQYYYHYRGQTNHHRVFRRVSGVGTQIGSTNATAVSGTKTVRLEIDADGNVIASMDGTTYVSGTNNQLTGNVRAGMYIGSNEGATNFEAADLAAGGATTAYFESSLRLQSGLEAQPGRRAYFESSLQLQSSLEAQPERRAAFSSLLALQSGFQAASTVAAQFASSLSLQSSFAASAGVSAAFSSLLALQSGFAAAAGRAVSFASSLALQSGFRAEPERRAEFAASLRLESSFEAEVDMPSATLFGGDNTHLVTDGPRINAPLLNHAAKSSSGVVTLAGRGMRSTTSGHANNLGGTRDIPAGRPAYGEWLVLDASGSAAAVGLVPSGYGGGSHLTFFYESDGTNGIGYLLSGVVRLNASTAATYTALAVNDVGMIAFDPDTRRVWYGRNGTWNGDPAAGTGEAATMAAGTYRFGATSGTTVSQVHVNFGQRPFVYTPPAGFDALRDE